MRQRFDDVLLALASIHGFSAREHEVVVELLKLCPARGGRGWERSTEMVTAGAATEFSWPDFDHWQAFFTARKTFPARWDGLHVAPPPQTREAEAYQHRKLDLLVEWLEMLAHRSTVLAHYARHGMRVRIARQQAGLACPVCDPFNAREVGPGHDAMPPFHPGCRCVLLAVHTAPSRRRPRAYERPRSRAG